VVSGRSPTRRVAGTQPHPASFGAAGRPRWPSDPRSLCLISPNQLVAPNSGTHVSTIGSSGLSLTFPDRIWGVDRFVTKPPSARSMAQPICTVSMKASQEGSRCLGELESSGRSRSVRSLCAIHAQQPRQGKYQPPPGAPVRSSRCSFLQVVVTLKRRLGPRS